MGIEGRIKQQVIPEHTVSHEEPSTSEWIILHCKPRKEELVAAQLATEQIETFIPWFGVTQGLKPTRINLLPSYLFAKLDTIKLAMAWVRTRNGVNHLVMDGETYAKVPNIIVETIKDRVNKVDTVDATGFPLYEGNKVEVAQGPLKGLIGVFDNKLSARQRILVILESSRNVRVEIHASKVRRMW